MERTMGKETWIVYQTATGVVLGAGASPADAWQEAVTCGGVDVSPDYLCFDGCELREEDELPELYTQDGKDEAVG